MSYTKAKKAKKEISQRLVNAERIAAEKESELEQLKEEFQQSYEDMIDVKAKAAESIDGISKKDVKASQKKNQDLKASIVKLKEEIDIKNRSAELLKEQYQKAEEKFKEAGMKYYSQKKQPIDEKLVSAIQELEDAIDQLLDLQKKARSDGLNIDTFDISGKSEIYISKSRLSGMEMRKLINTKSLQSQLTNEE